METNIPSFMIPMPPEPIFTDVFCPEVGWETARDGFCVSCGATDHREAGD